MSVGYVMRTASTDASVRTCHAAGTSIATTNAAPIARRPKRTTRCYYAAAMTIRLTQLAKRAGCAAKHPPGYLLPLLGDLPRVTDPNVIVGSSTADDAAIYKLSDDTALVLTTDFFTPVVDDPYDFGAVAAANALSDVYAMGGTPVTALNIVGFPEELDAS